MQLHDCSSDALDFLPYVTNKLLSNAKGWLQSTVNLILMKYTLQFAFSSLIDYHKALRED